MYKKFLTTAVVSFALLLSYSSFVSASNESGSDSAVHSRKDAAVAEYNGHAVTSAEVMKQFEAAFENDESLKTKKFSDLEAPVREQMVKMYVQAKLIEDAANESKIRDTEDYKSKLVLLERGLITQLYIESIIKKKVTESELRHEYKALKKEMANNEEVKTSHILVDSEEKLKEVQSKLKAGAKFEDLVAEYSVDEGSKAKGGTLGYVSKGKLVPEYEAKAFSMKVGQISDPVKTQFGWHIIKLEDKRPVQVPTFEEAKAGLESNLARKILDDLIQELSKKANVKYFP